MAGGNSRGARRRCARRLTAGLLGGLLLAPASAGLCQAADAAEEPSTAAGEECNPRPAEKSIIVGEGHAVPDLADVVVATDHSSADELEPIANVSEYEPELAEGGGEPATPTPADASEDAVVEAPGDAPATPGTPEAPTADDVCIENEAPPATKAPSAPKAPPAKIEAASFNGVTPGLTTRDEVIEKWGQPEQATRYDRHYSYQLENFPSISVSFSEDLVDAIRIELGQPSKAADLAAKLGMSGLRPLAIPGAAGAANSTMFPERGVSFNHRSDELVREIVIQPIESDAFLQRAELAAPRDYGHRIADLETALELDSQSVQARVMLSELKLAIGEVTAAERLAAEAVQLAPRADECRLQWARCLKYQARYDEAVEQTKLVLEGTTAPQIVRAQALEQMGLLAALGSKQVQERAMPLHNKAIELADQLAASDDPATSAAANQLLVSAHLAIAHRVALGDWQNKSKAVEQWLGRASGIAEQMIEAGEADVSLRLQVALAGLAAGGRLDPPVDPTPWIAEAEEAAVWRWNDDGSCRH
jgi:tetratricopeptide (TPR) repeat protein